MARIRNNEDYNAKKKQILQNALNLLAKDGYQKFSINRVIESSQMTKGAFFHYYKSKDELVYGLVDLLNTPIVDAISEVADMKHLNPKEKVLNLFQAAYKAKDLKNKSIDQFARLIYLEENAIILHLLVRDVVQQCTPLFERVFTEGIEQGVFKFQHPHGVAFHFLRSILDTNEAIGRAFLETDPEKINWNELKQKIEAFEWLAVNLFDLTESQSFYGEEVLQMIDARAQA
ncbi:TetR/AcrR family transcriptional regulator [Vallitalea okinawensis]|uniref:TetR/AcrR family transcriptional regulator n=1 Tax=Vallitalea okinawensis TaxID=2078660 RepID=UPI000CFD150C|nr:TetR/AcrR family transcriptional regulator [Vallitalea okinawensis]